MIVFGFLLGFTLTAPVFFALGLFAGVDRVKTHEPADIRPALRRGVR